jgi:hypothetical protein
MATYGNRRSQGRQPARRVKQTADRLSIVVRIWSSIAVAFVRRETNKEANNKQTERVMRINSEHKALAGLLEAMGVTEIVEFKAPRWDFFVWRLEDSNGQPIFACSQCAESVTQGAAMVGTELTNKGRTDCRCDVCSD